MVVLAYCCSLVVLVVALGCGICLEFAWVYVVAFDDLVLSVMCSAVSVVLLFWVFVLVFMLVYGVLLLFVICVGSFAWV